MERRLSEVAKAGRAGGAAASGGMTFQATVTAIAMTAMARGVRLGWLPDADDTPVEVASESHGAGDDIRLVLRNGDLAEVQCKKGLSRSIHLWDPLLALAEGVGTGTIQWGVLAVCPQTSGTVRGLGQEIRRLADGRRDGLSPIGRDLVARLEGRGLPVAAVCGKLSLHVIAAIDGDEADIRAAKARLEPLIEKDTDVEAAWRVLERDGHALMRRRGARTAAAVARMLEGAEITLADSTRVGPGVLAAKLARWTRAVNAEFKIIGVDRGLPTVEALDLQCHVLGAGERYLADLEAALNRYHNPGSQNRNEKSVDPTTVGRFYRHAVVLAGPGMGKSTLVKRWALEYAQDDLPVLRVSLRDIAQRMRAGEPFLDAVFRLGLTGSGLTAVEARQAFSDWVLLGDGLDECGEMQEAVAEGLIGFAAAFPRGRALVTSRPIGYQPARLGAWRHYEIAPFQSYSASFPLANLLATVLAEDDPRQAEVYEIAQRELSASQAAKLGARSAFILSLAASLLARGGTLGGSKADLYERLLKLVEQEPPARAAAPPASDAIRRRVLELLGWVTMQDLLQSRDAALSNVAALLAKDLDKTLLAARDIVERCLTHWEALGLIETLRHGDSELLVFVHKTFGEYLAARYLANLPVPERDAELASRLDQLGWAEVFDFVASQGDAERLVKLLLNHQASPSVSRVKHALELSAAYSPVSAELAEQLVAIAYEFLDHRDRGVAIKVAWPLAEYWATKPTAQPPPSGLLQSSKLLTQLASWCCALEAESANYRIEDLEELLLRLPSADLSGFNRKRGFLFSLGENGETTLAERVIVLGSREFLRRGDKARSEAVLAPILAMPNFGSTEYFRAMTAVFVEAEIPRQIESQRTERSTLEPYPPEYRAAGRMAFAKLASAFAVPEDEVPGEEAEHCRPPIDLAAFLAVTELEAPRREVWEWESIEATAALRHVLSAVLALSDLDEDSVRREARVQMRMTAADNGPYAGFPYLVHVDAPPVDWAKTARISLDVEMLREVLLTHPAESVARLAAHLIQSGLGEVDRRRIGLEALEGGRGAVAAYGAVLLQEIDGDEAATVLHRRLADTSRRHHAYLYQLLRELPPTDEATLEAALKSGLFAEHDAAMSAARAAEHFARDGRPLLLLLREAWNHWRDIEVNWTESGRPANSPREALLSAFEALGAVDLEWLIQTVLEPGSRLEHARKLLWDRLRDAPDDLASVLDRILRGELRSDLLHMIVREKLPIGIAHLQVLAEYISDADEGRREIAGLVAKYGHLDPARVEHIAATLFDDDAEHLRDLGREVLVALRAKQPAKRLS
jgi:hypothetical protein